MRFIPFLLLMAACNTASPEFRGVPATRVVVDGSTFDVRVRDNRAEALRVNAEYAPRFGPIRERARTAMAQVSGCEVRKVTGDQAMAFGSLKCGDKEPVQPTVVQALECVPQRGTTLRGVGRVTVDVDCYSA